MVWFSGVNIVIFWEFGWFLGLSWTFCCGSGPICRVFGPEVVVLAMLRPDMPCFRAGGCDFCRAPGVPLAYVLGEDVILYARSSPKLCVCPVLLEKVPLLKSHLPHKPPCVRAMAFVISTKALGPFPCHFDQGPWAAWRNLFCLYKEKSLKNRKRHKKHKNLHVKGLRDSLLCCISSYICSNRRAMV